MGLHFIEIKDLEEDIKSIDGRLTVVEGDVPQLRKALTLLRRHIEAARKRKREEELTCDFKNLIKAVKAEDVKHAWKLFTKDKK